MKTWRLPESEQVYTIYREANKDKFQNRCLICEIPIKQRLGLFNIVPNEFPYDAVSTLNDMLVLAVHQPCLTIPLMRELEKTKELLAWYGTYDLMLENMPSKKTVPGHWHLHLLRLRPLEGSNNDNH